MTGLTNSDLGARRGGGGRSPRYSATNTRNMRFHRRSVGRCSAEASSYIVRINKRLAATTKGTGVILTAMVCHTVGKGDEIKWRILTPLRKNGRWSSSIPPPSMCIWERGTKKLARSSPTKLFECVARRRRSAEIISSNNHAVEV